MLVGRMYKLILSFVIATIFVFVGGVVYFSHDSLETQGEEIICDSSEARMPAVFDGFIERWNRDVHLWAQGELERVTIELERAIARGASNRIELLSKEKMLLEERCRIVDVLAEYRANQLPQALHEQGKGLKKGDEVIWQNGAEEPDIGDAQAKKGGNMTLWNCGPFPPTLRAFGPGSKNYFNHSLYDTVEMPLVAMHPATKKMMPGLASSWAIGADGKTVFYRIDPRARYSDGLPVKARDFLLNMCLRTSDFAKDPYWVSHYRDNILAVRTYGDDVIAVTMPYPMPYLPARAAKNFLPASPAFYRDFDASFVEKYQWRAAPTTGGYTVLSRDILWGRRLVMSRVKNWWAKELPFYHYSCNVDTITHLFMADEGKILEMFHQGEVDALTVHKSKIWNEQLETPELANGAVQKWHLTTDYPCPPFGIFLNTAIAPLDSHDVRRGVMHALNMDRVIEVISQGDFARLESYAEGYGALTKKTRNLSYSPERARAFFARAGYDRVGDDGVLMNAKGERLSLEFTFAGVSPTIQNMSSILRQDARLCGLDLRLEALDPSVCSRKVFEKRHQMVFWANVLPYPTPELNKVFHSSLAYDDRGRLVPHTDNLTSIADNELDQVLLQEKWAKNEEELRHALHAVQSRLAELCIWVPAWRENGARVASWGWVKWPDSKETQFCYPMIDDPLESHLYWIDLDKKREIRRNGR
ncbi:MAG: ABC transporter substrate-binding protein [Akkermansia sp.]